MCNPSRASFLSGRYPESTSVLNNNTDPRTRLGKSHVFLPEYFKAHGYFTAEIGKVAHQAELRTPSHGTSSPIPSILDKTETTRRTRRKAGAEMRAASQRQAARSGNDHRGQCNRIPVGGHRE